LARKRSASLISLSSLGDQKATAGIEKNASPGILNMTAPAYEPDDGPLTDADIASIRAAASPFMPKGKRLSFRSLL
jgi:hypothetical protein